MRLAFLIALCLGMPGAADAATCIASFGEAFSALPFEDPRTTGEQL
jgi:hypothetical protein